MWVMDCNIDMSNNYPEMLYFSEVIYLLVGLKIS